MFTTYFNTSHIGDLLAVPEGDHFIVGIIDTIEPDPLILSVWIDDIRRHLSIYEQCLHMPRQRMRKSAGTMIGKKFSRTGLIDEIKKHVNPGVKVGS